MKPTLRFLALLLGLLAAAPCRGQMTAVDGVYADTNVPGTVIAFELLASPTNNDDFYWVTWSGTNAVPFTESMIASVITNEPYGSPVYLTLEAEQTGGKYEPIETLYFDPGQWTNGQTVLFWPSNNAPLINVLPATNPPAITLQWTNMLTTSNSVQLTHDLASGVWVTVTNFQSSLTETVTFPRTDQNTFYRAVAWPPSPSGQPTFTTN